MKLGDESHNDHLIRRKPDRIATVHIPGVGKFKVPLHDFSNPYSSGVAGLIEVSGEDLDIEVSVLGPPRFPRGSTR